MRILIAGCGDLGTEAGLRFAAAGHEVVAVRRRPELLPPTIVGVRGDITTGRIDELPPDVEVVVHAAAADDRSEAAYLGAYLEGPRRVLDALVRWGARPRRLLFVSSTAVYGAVDDGSWVDESSPTRPAGVTGEILVAAEQAVLERGPQPSVVRLSGIYGPGRTRLIDQVREGRARLPEPPYHSNRIHRDDAAAALVHLALRREEPDPIYLGSDDDPADHAEVLRFLAELLEVPEPPSGPVERRRGGDKRCRNDRLVATGFGFRYPSYREGYPAVHAGEGTRHP